MIAASVWSLLIPAIEEAESQGMAGWIPAAGGFVLGIAFLMGLDFLLPHLHPGSAQPEGAQSHLKRTTLMVLAVTLHNIPEGMAVGLSFALAAQHGGDPALYCRRHGVGVGHRHPKLPRRGGHLPAHAAGGHFVRPGLSLWQHVRHRGACCLAS